MTSERMKAVEEICNTLRGHDNFLILTHRKPDGDTLGSAYALREALLFLGKKAQVACPDCLTKKYRFLNGGAEVEEYSGGSDYIITVDIADAEQMLGSKYKELLPNIRMAIDHHRTNSYFAKDINAVFPECAACGEIIYEVIRTLGAPVNQRAAEALYTAISTDTGCFRFANTTENTHRVAADLYSLGFDFSELNYLLFTMKTAARMELEKLLYQNITMHLGGKVCFAFLPKDAEQKTGADETDADGISDILRAGEGVRLGILARENESGVRISMRANGDLDAAKICQVFGGGGHKGAAGCNLPGTLEEAKAKLLKTLEEYIT